MPLASSRRPQELLREAVEVAARRGALHARLVAAVGLVVLAPAGQPSPAAWVGGGAAVVLAVAGAVASRTDPGSRLPFTAAMAVAVVSVVVLVLAGPAIAG